MLFDIGASYGREAWGIDHVVSLSNRGCSVIHHLLPSGTDFENDHRRGKNTCRNIWSTWGGAFKEETNINFFSTIEFIHRYEIWGRAFAPPPCTLDPSLITILCNKIHIQYMISTSTSLNHKGACLGLVGHKKYLDKCKPSAMDVYDQIVGILCDVIFPPSQLRWYITFFYVF